MKSLPRDTATRELPLAVAVALFAAVVLACWLVAVVVFVGALVVGGSVGLLLVLVAMAAVGRGLR